MAAFRHFLAYQGKWWKTSMEFRPCFVNLSQFNPTWMRSPKSLRWASRVSGTDSQLFYLLDPETVRSTVPATGAVMPTPSPMMERWSDRYGFGPAGHIEDRPDWCAKGQ